MKKRILAVTALMMSATILPVQASDVPTTEQTESLATEQTEESSEQSGSPATGEVVIMDVTTSPKYSYQETEVTSEETGSEEEKALPKTGDFSFFEKIREAISNFFYRK